MADAKQCDICGAYYGFTDKPSPCYTRVEKDMKFQHIILGNYGIIVNQHTASFDVCPKCASKISDFLYDLKNAPGLTITDQTLFDSSNSASSIN